MAIICRCGTKKEWYKNFKFVMISITVISLISCILSLISFFVLDDFFLKGTISILTVIVIMLVTIIFAFNTHLIFSYPPKTTNV